MIEPVSKIARAKSRAINSPLGHVTLLIILTLALALPGLASLPVIDRDEARYAQASVQMAQTGDLLNIRFQGEARNKKPAGVYWLQTAALKTFSRSDKRQIWVHRLPSVLGALLAILATYWGGAKLIGREPALISAALLATSLLFVFEAHIAKTDAVLCGLAASILAAISVLRARDFNHGANINTDTSLRLPVWLFWLSLGSSIMIKGPILLAVLGFTLLGLWLWEKTLSWAKPLLAPLPIIVFILIWLPWAIAIYTATDGAFFKDSLGQDLGGKLITSQESHPGPPGYHLSIIWLMIWPASLFLLPAVIGAAGILRGHKPKDTAQINALRLCAVWIIPFWALIEIMPTKLPHYSLVLYPAICLLIGASLSELKRPDMLKKSRLIGAVLFLIASAVLIGALVYLSFAYGKSAQKMTAVVMAFLAGAGSLYAARKFTQAKIYKALSAMVYSALIISVSGYQLILPQLASFNLSARIAQALGQDLPRLGGKDLISPSFTEPSLVYHLGTEIVLGGRADPLNMDALKAGRIILVDDLSDKTQNLLVKLETRAKVSNICLARSGPVSGLNYAKGDSVEIYIIKAEPCA